MRAPSNLAILPGRMVTLTLLVVVSLLAACGQPLPRSSGAVVGAVTTPTLDATVTPAPATPGISTSTRTAMATPTSPTPRIPTRPPTQVPTPTATFVPSSLVPGLADALATVSAFHVEDEWTGLSSTASETAHFDLTRQGNGYVGTARFTVAGYQQKPSPSAESNIAIPPDVAQAFFALLALTPAHTGRCQPRIEHTDDYPDLQIALTTDLGPVVFFSQSQGTHHTPWGLNIAGVSYIINVETPNRAILLLSPYLDYEKQELLLDKVLYGNTTTVPSALALCSPATASSRPATTVPNTPPRDLVALYGLEQTYSLVITGAGVGPIAQEQKLVRDPDRLATFLTALKQPTAQTDRPGRYNDDLKNTIYLNWRTSEGRKVTLAYDPVVGILSYYEGNQGAYYAVSPVFATALRSHPCLPTLPQTGG